MANRPYLPRNDSDKVVWLRTFSNQFATIATPFGFTAADVTLVSNLAGAFTYAVNLGEAGKNFSQQCTTYKDAMRSGPLGTVNVAIPVFTVPPGAPAAVPTGIFKKISTYVARIKSSSLYTEDIGKNLGIIGSEIDDNMDQAQPGLKLILTGGKIRISYIKGTADSLRLMCKRGNEADFSLLNIITKSTYDDSRPNTEPGKAETRQYCAYFVVEDEIVGQMSDLVSVTI